MDFIENTFNSENELTLEEGKKMVDEFAVITASYNSLVDVYEYNKPKFTERHFKIIKNMS
jgi:hypothetical protein